MNKDKFQSLMDRVIILLKSRNDLSIAELAKVIDRTRPQISDLLTNLRKKGYHIYPSHGPGTPLEIAETATQEARFSNWRRRRYLPTTKRLVINEVEMAENHSALEKLPEQLLKEINNAPNETPNDRD